MIATTSDQKRSVMKLLAEDDEGGAADKLKLDEKKESYWVDCRTSSPVDGKDMDQDDNGGDSEDELMDLPREL